MKLAVAVIFALVCHLAICDVQVGKYCKSTSFYWTGSNCSSCPAGCTDCVSKNNAPSCINCASGKYLNIVNDIGSCTNCTGNCTQCRGPAVTDCMKAVDGFSIAPTGIFKCSIPGCSYCNSNAACDRCEFGYRLANGTCTKCTDGNCAECPNAVSTCTRCQYKYQVASGICTTCDLGCLDCPCTTCLPGFRFNNGTCTKCTVDQCTTCAANNSQCTACFSGFWLSNTTCVKCSADNCVNCTSDKQCTGCSTGYVLNNGNCTKCPDNCNQCNTNNECSSCKNNYILSADKKSCIQCPGSCVECLNDGSCNKCSIGKVLSSDKKNCNGCPGNCDVCSNTTTCTQCSAGYNLNSKGGCTGVYTCNRGEQLDLSNNCTNGTIENCVYGQNGSCFTCADAFYSKDKSCLPCQNGCAKCDIWSKLSCLKVAQPGFSIVRSDGADDKTGYLGTSIIATVQRNNTVDTCMPNNYIARPILNKGNKQCVTKEKCTYPAMEFGNWICYIDGSNAVKITVSIITIVVVALYML